MRNFKNNRRRYRNNGYDKNLKLNSNEQNLTTSLGNVSDFKRKNFSRNNFNSPKLIQKYSDLAREALSGGDKILYENYLQHAEHFIRQSNTPAQVSNSSNNSSDVIKDISLNKTNKEQDSNTKEEV